MSLSAPKRSQHHRAHKSVIVTTEEENEDDLSDASEYIYNMRMDRIENLLL